MGTKKRRAEALLIDEDYSIAWRNPCAPAACMAALVPSALAMPVRTAMRSLIQKLRFVPFLSGLLPVMVLMVYLLP